MSELTGCNGMYRIGFVATRLLLEIIAEIEGCILYQLLHSLVAKLIGNRYQNWLQGPGEHTLQVGCALLGGIFHCIMIIL